VSRADQAFGDPLLPATAGAAATRARLRLAGAILFGAGAATLAAVLASPDPDTSDHAPLAACGIGFAVVAIVLLAWRRAPDIVLRAICPLGSVATALVTAFAEPIALTPVYLVWPLLIAAYFFRQRELLLNFAFGLALVGIVLATAVDPVLRLATFLGVAGLAGSVTVIVAALREQVRVAVDALEARAAIDPLTRALNRGAFEDRLESEVARASRAGADCALLVLDVDHFKRINDSHGHAAGDEALRRLAACVDGAMRRSDVFARIGGEEFAVILPDTNAAGAIVLADHLRRCIASADLQHPMTVSVGVTDRSISGDSPRGMLADADEAMYAAKRQGRDRVVAAARLVLAG
jgi:diguanylate cyclase (GGDEF)-like protein